MKKTAFGATLTLAVMMLGCGDGIGDVTSGGPSATPTPVPTPLPTATPVATPTPTPTTNTLSCNLPARLPNCDAQCCRAGGSVRWRSQIEAAQADLTRTQPSLFNPGGNVRDNVQYMNALAKRLTEMFGLCTGVLGHDEIRVKEDQNFSQHIDVLISDVTPWVGGAYTCEPASF